MSTASMIPKMYWLIFEYVVQTSPKMRNWEIEKLRNLRKWEKSHHPGQTVCLMIMRIFVDQ